MAAAAASNEAAIAATCAASACHSAGKAEKYGKLAAASASLAAVPADPETAAVLADPETAPVSADPETAPVSADPETAPVSADPETAAMLDVPQCDCRMKKTVRNRSLHLSKGFVFDSFNGTSVPLWMCRRSKCGFVADQAGNRIDSHFIEK